MARAGKPAERLDDRGCFGRPDTTPGGAVSTRKQKVGTV